MNQKNINSSTATPMNKLNILATWYKKGLYMVVIKLKPRKLLLKRFSTGGIITCALDVEVFSRTSTYIQASQFYYDQKRGERGVS